LLTRLPLGKPPVPLLGLIHLSLVGKQGKGAIAARMDGERGNAIMAMQQQKQGLAGL